MQNQDQQQNQLKSLSDSELLLNLELLSAKENKTTVELLLHLSEVEERKLFLPAGYSSLFDYCVRRLRYSEPAAVRRISSARAVGKFPALKQKLLLRELSLTTLSLVSKVLTPENWEGVIFAIQGKSRREVEEIISGYTPRPSKPKETIKPLCIVRPRCEKPLSLFGAPEAGEHSRKSSRILTFASGCGEPVQGEVKEGLKSHTALPMPAECVGDSKAPLVGNSSETRLLGDCSKAPLFGDSASVCSGTEQHEPRFEVKFTIGATAREKLEEAKRLLSGKYPQGVRLEDVFEEALEYLLEKRSPERRMKRRKCQNASRRSSAGRNDIAGPQKSVRHIPAALRDEVHARDGGRCAYVSPDGVRCLERMDLEIHHVMPYGLGGKAEASNLSLLCKLCRVRHNRHYADCRIMPNESPALF